MATEDRIRRLQRRYEQQDANSISTALKSLLSTADGRRFAWLFLADCRVFQQPFNGNALGTAFACGELNVGQRFLAQLTQADPDAFLVMQEENMKNERERQQSADRAAADDSDE